MEKDAFSPENDAHARIIMLLYGVFADEKRTPFWCYVAIKPSRFHEFLKIHKQGGINLSEFKEWGEPIVMGTAESQPKPEITQQVAEKYGVDPSLFFSQADPAEELERKLEFFKVLQQIKPA